MSYIFTLTENLFSYKDVQLNVIKVAKINLFYHQNI